MATNKHNHRAHGHFRPKPYAMVGAGKLVSTLWKSGDQQAGWRYHFNLFRMTARGQVGQLLSPGDLIDLIKLARVLAATLAEDGCLSSARRRELACLAAMLDHLFPPKD